MRPMGMHFFSKFAQMFIERGKGIFDYFEDGEECLFVIRRSAVFEIKKNFFLIRKTGSEHLKIKKNTLCFLKWLKKIK